MMRRRHAREVFFVAAALTLAGLGPIGCLEEEEPPLEVIEEDDSEEADSIRSDEQRDLSPEVRPEQIDRLAADGRAFGMDLYHELVARQEGNLFYSPYSISTALAMTYGGARGETERQMAEVMHFSLGQEELHTAFNWLDLELASRAESAPEDAAQPFTFNLVNAVWAQRGYPFESEFLDILSINYDAGLQVVDFVEDPEACRQEINQWTSEQTEGRIEELIEPDLIVEMTKMVLVNAIYFAASWSSAFQEGSTRDRVFHTLDGQVSTPMMHQLSRFRYAEGRGYQALELLYEGGELGMVVILPEEGEFESFESTLDVEALDDILVALNDGSGELVSLALPRFSFRTPSPLVEPLESLGMVDAFVPGVADFTGIADRPMWISHVVHEAFVAVDENGTEAAAATAVIIDGDADGDPDYQSFVADRPFMFLIRDIPTNTVVFLGRVLDPSQGSL